MHAIYKLEEMLCEELEKIGEKEELTAGSLETADKLAHALKNVQKIISYYEEMGDGEEYSGAGGNMGGGGGNQGGGSSNRSYRGGNSRTSYARGGGSSYERGRSYARSSARAGRGRNAARDSMGRYSSAEGMEDLKMELEELMNEAPNQNFRKRIQELVSEMDMM